MRRALAELLYRWAVRLHPWVAHQAAEDARKRDQELTAAMVRHLRGRKPGIDNRLPEGETE